MFGLVVGLSLVSTAAAQDRLAEAERAFRQAEVAYEQGDYVGALESFQRAHELTGNPEILYNVGVVADRLGRDELALESFELYLRGRPGAEDRADVEAKIAAIRARLDSGPAEPEVDEVTAEQTTDRVAEDRSGGWLWTWFALGGALISGGLSTYFWIDANSTFDDLEEQCATQGCDQTDIDDSGGKLAVTLHQVFLTSALVLGAAAVTLFILEAPSGESAELALGPGTLSVRGQF